MTPSASEPCFCVNTNSSTVQLLTVGVLWVNYPIVCCYQLVLAFSAISNNNGGHLDFPTWNWNVVDWSATSFPASNSDFRGKWKTPSVILKYFFVVFVIPDLSQTGSVTESNQIKIRNRTLTPVWSEPQSLC